MTLGERIKALRRRRSPEPGAEEVSVCRGIMVDRVRYKAAAEGQPLHLTRSEFRLLDTLIRQPGRVFGRSELIDSALGEDTMVLERTIDVHIRALRKKLGASADLIETVRGVGYRFRDAEPVAEFIQGQRRFKRRFGRHRAEQEGERDQGSGLQLHGGEADAGDFLLREFIDHYPGVESLTAMHFYHRVMILAPDP